MKAPLTAQEIQENKKIMAFMGLEPKLESPDRYGWSDAPFFYMSNEPYESAVEAMAKYLKYHSSWDALKPVIDKIIQTIGVKVIDECDATEWRVSTNVAQMYIGVDITQAVHYVMEYIDWYNNSNKTK